MSKTTLTALAAIAALAVPATASAAKYSGTTKQSRPVTFKVRGGKVHAFQGGVNMFCSQSGIQFNAAIPPRPMKLRGGRFSYKGRDKSDSTNIVIKGKVSGARASGTVQQSDSTYFASSGTFDSCTGSAKWTARRR
jgi:hypothetical protein